MNVPFLDLKTQYKQIEHEVLPLITEAMANGMFIGGPNVEGFEKEFAEFCSAKYCIGVNSGTDALRFALMAAGVGPGDEVVTVPNTFIATTEAISQTGAVPVFVDIDDHTCNMDPQKLEEFLEQKCTFNQSTNQPVNQSTSQPVNQSPNQPINQSPRQGDCSSASIRPARRHGCHSDYRRKIQPVCHRGCLSGPRRIV
jgi:hypothetical protein